MILSPDHFLVDADGRYDWSPAGVRSAWAATARRVREMLTDPRFSGVVLLVGIPASGKTTWLRDHEDRRIIYVDATFTKRAHREPFVSLAREAGKPVGVIVFDTPFEECVRRNDLRPADRRVPVAKMMKFRDEVAAEPVAIEEGFAWVTRVTP